MTTQRRENEISGDIVDAACRVHTTLGPGLMGSVYEAVVARELMSRGRRGERQVPIGVRYDADAARPLWLQEPHGRQTSRRPLRPGSGPSAQRASHPLARVRTAESSPAAPGTWRTRSRAARRHRSGRSASGGRSPRPRVFVAHRHAAAVPGPAPSASRTFSSRQGWARWCSAWKPSAARPSPRPTRGASKAERRAASVLRGRRARRGPDTSAPRPSRRGRRACRKWRRTGLARTT